MKPGFTKNGSLTVVAKANTGYTGSITVTITAIGQTKLSDLPALIKGMPSNTTKDTALQNFLDLNKDKYPDLIGNVTLDTASFVESSYLADGSYTINALPNGKYSGSVEVTIPMKVKVKLGNVIKNTELTGNVSENEVIAKILAANPESGLVTSDLRVTNFVAPQIATPGSATINAVDESGFTDSVNITIILVPKDQELTEIINKIKATPPKTLAAIEVWKEYFAYYSQEKIQYLVNLLNTKYIVWRTESDADKRSSLTTQVKGNISNLLDQVIVHKDGLGDNRYDDFGIVNPTVVEFDSTHNLFTIKIPLNFIWNSQNDISSETTWTETRTIAIKFEQVEKPS